MGVTILPAAERDLEGIHEHTVDEWGVGQAQRYVVGLWKTLDHLVAFPRSGMGIGASGGLRIWNYESHRIIYREREGGIEVVRIFHAARDIDRLLKSHIDWDERDRMETD